MMSTRNINENFSKISLKNCFLELSEELSKELKTSSNQPITKTYLYNFDPHKPHFYIVKLGFTRVYIIFLISAQKQRFWILGRTASQRRFY